MARETISPRTAYWACRREEGVRKGGEVAGREEEGGAAA